MSSVCKLCGKGTTFGRTVSKTGTRGWVKRRSKRRFKPNLRRVRVLVKGETKRITLCSSCLKSRKVRWVEA